MMDNHYSKKKPNGIEILNQKKLKKSKARMAKSEKVWLFFYLLKKINFLSLTKKNPPKKTKEKKRGVCDFLADDNNY